MQLAITDIPAFPSNLLAMIKCNVQLGVIQQKVTAGKNGIDYSYLCLFAKTSITPIQHRLILMKENLLVIISAGVCFE